MGRSDEPVDLLINLGPVRGDEVEIFMEEHGAGQAGSQLDAMRLEEVASSYGFLQQEGAGVFEFAQLGQKLFGDLFAGAHQRRIYLRASDTAEREDRPLRILVRLPHDSPLSRLPWELLHDGERFLAKDPRCSVVRYFYGGRVQPFQVDPPLRVLLTSACPRSQPPLHLETEIRAVTAAYQPAGKAVDLQVVPGVSLGRLEQLWNEAELARRPFHVWHHCGHGHLSTRGGTPRFFLSLEENGEAQYASTEQLSEIVGMCPGLRLAVLNVCHGGYFAGLAPELAKLNIPVVIGFPSRVANDTAYRFAATFHQNLLHIPVELAVSQARRSLCVHRSSDLDWSHPLLFSRRKDNGPILRPPKPTSIAKRPAMGKRPPRGFTIETGPVHADEVINAYYAGAGPPPVELPPIEGSIKHKSIRAKSVKNFGFLIAPGFSLEDLRQRETQMAELLNAIDEGCAEES